VKGKLLAVAVPVAAGFVLATATAGLAATAQVERTAMTQIEGLLAPDSCGTAQTVTLSSPSRLEVNVGATNSAGILYARVVGPDGRVHSTTGAYDTPSSGDYTVQLCSMDDGIDTSWIVYSGSILTSS
jgi:hypothetical protein